MISTEDKQKVIDRLLGKEKEKKEFRMPSYDGSGLFLFFIGLFCMLWSFIYPPYYTLLGIVGIVCCSLYIFNKWVLFVRY
jgi:hypothetical protein